MRMIDGILMELEQEAQATKRVLERVPADKLSWRPHAKSMSLGQLALHMATSIGQVAQMSTLDEIEIPKFGQPEATSTKEILDAFETSLAQAKEVLGGMDDAKVMGTWTAKAGGNVIMAVPRIGLLRTILLNHWYHHRGQMTVYLRLLDVPVPSVYGPTADENPFG